MALAIAYVPRFGVSPFDTSAAGSEAGSGRQTATKSTVTTSEGEEDDDDDDDDETKSRTAYDWPGIALRLKRMMPLIFPRQSRLAYILIGKLLRGTCN